MAVADADLIADLHRAILNDPSRPDLYNDLAIALGEMAADQASLRAYRLGLALAPDQPILRLNLGVHYRRAGAIELAMDLFRDLVHTQPDLAEAGFNLALLYLSVGRWTEGWPLYEQRFALRNPARLLLQPVAPRWALGAVVPRLWVIAEQGMGDVLHFVRWLPCLRRWAAELVLVVHPALVPLLQANQVADQVLVAQAGLGAQMGPWMPLLSVPDALTTRGVDPGQVASFRLGCPSSVVEHWRNRLQLGSAPLIGLFWQGNPQAETGDYRGRSMALEQLEPLLLIPGLSWVALQKRPGLEQLEGSLMRQFFIAQQEAVSGSMAFLDTAAVALLCRLVITTDSAVAHLCGALGVPTWLLLQHQPDWRWGQSESTPSLYPSLRLFRQTQRGDWDGVIQAVRQALLEGLSP